jgi:hypothetical protein
MKLYSFRTVPLSIIRSLFTVHSAMVYVINFCRQLSSRTRTEIHGVPSWSCSKAVYRSVWHIPLLSLQWINSWWCTEELSETCRISWQNHFLKLVHLVGFIIKKAVLCLLKLAFSTSVLIGLRFPLMTSRREASSCLACTVGYMALII